MHTPKEIIESAKDFATRQKSDYLVLKTKTQINAAMTGAVAGLMIGYYKKYNIYVSALVGIVVCTVVASQFVPKKEDDDQDE